jgi:hypothetical protein
VSTWNAALTICLLLVWCNISVILRTNMVDCWYTMHIATWSLHPGVFANIAVDGFHVNKAHLL